MRFPFTGLISVTSLQRIAHLNEFTCDSPRWGRTLNTLDDSSHSLTHSLTHSPASSAYLTSVVNKLCARTICQSPLMAESELSITTKVNAFPFLLIDSKSALAFRITYGNVLELLSMSFDPRLGSLTWEILLPASEPGKIRPRTSQHRYSTMISFCSL
jgi:hypothetical protein